MKKARAIVSWDIRELFSEVMTIFNPIPAVAPNKIKTKEAEMPIYEYKCETCGHEFEKLVLGKNAEKDITCPKCNRNKIKRLLSPTGFISKTGGNSRSAGAPKGFS
jgi:putative FmdB family regulatory protein